MEGEMGYTYIMIIRDDALGDAGKGNRQKQVEEVGEAVVNLCADISYYGKLIGGKRFPI